MTDDSAKLELTFSQFLEVTNIATGTYAPVAGFMGSADLKSVVSDMRLTDGSPFPIPIVLQTKKELADRFARRDSIELVFAGKTVAQLSISEIFDVNLIEIARAVFGTDSFDHPGVRFMAGDPSRNVMIAGIPKQVVTRQSGFGSWDMTPAESRAYIAEMGWRTVAGFQTRNVPHRAHEYLQRTALEVCDGLLIHPLVGWKKKGDFTPEAVLAGYQALISNYYPANRVKLALLLAPMRYAGPREALLHAIIRRNYGCTHFIVGRDHAGVGDFYGKYDAHALADRFRGELGIEILKLAGPFYCPACDGIATEKTCKHAHESPDSVDHIAGTAMRQMLLAGGKPQPHLMRQEVLDALKNVDLFVTGEDQ